MPINSSCAASSLSRAGEVGVDDLPLELTDCIVAGLRASREDVASAMGACRALRLSASKLATAADVFVDGEPVGIARFPSLGSIGTLRAVPPDGAGVGAIVSALAATASARLADVATLDLTPGESMGRPALDALTGLLPRLRRLILRGGGRGADGELLPHHLLRPSDAWFDAFAEPGFRIEELELHGMWQYGEQHEWGDSRPRPYITKLQSVTRLDVYQILPEELAEMPRLRHVATSGIGNHNHYSRSTVQHLLPPNVKVVIDAKYTFLGGPFFDTGQVRVLYDQESTVQWTLPHGPSQGPTLRSAAATLDSCIDVSEDVDGLDVYLSSHHNHMPSALETNTLASDLAPLDRHGIRCLHIRNTPMSPELVGGLARFLPSIQCVDLCIEYRKTIHPGVWPALLQLKRLSKIILSHGVHDYGYDYEDYADNDYEDNDDFDMVSKSLKMYLASVERDLVVEFSPHYVYPIGDDIAPGSRFGEWYKPFDGLYHGERPPVSKYIDELSRARAPGRPRVTYRMSVMRMEQDGNSHEYWVDGPV